MDDDIVSGITKYQNGPGIDNKLRQTNGSATSYLLADHLGSTNGLTNSSGALTASNTYDSFGNPTNSTFPSRYQFTGRELDSTTGLQYSRARFYDPKIGRFISEDPIGFAGGDANLYGYVWNNPYKFTDPFGLDGWGSSAADWADEKIDLARRWYKPDPQNWVRNGLVDTAADLASGLADTLRVGNGLGQALYCEDNGYGKAAFIAMDVARAAGIAGIVGGVGARFVPRNSFPGFNPSTPPSGYQWRGKPGSLPGSKDGNYYNPKTGESYRPDLNHAPPIGPHWDYRDAAGRWWRVFPDGTRVPK